MSSTKNQMAVTSPAELRNVVLVGASGSGKTTLFEHLLRARLTGYRGEKDDRERGASLALASVGSGSIVINLLDAPGHLDHVGELRAALRAADAAVFVVAATDGVDPATAQLWKECAAVNLPRAVVITKLDAERGSFEAVVEDCRQHFGDGVYPAYLPLKDDHGQIVGNMSLVTRVVHDYSASPKVDREATPDELNRIERYREPFIETIVTEAGVDEVIERYLDGEELATSMVASNLLAAVSLGHFHPVIPILHTNGAGVEELFSLIERGFPNPSLRPMPLVTTPGGGNLSQITPDPEGPLAAQVIRTTSDPYAGRVSMLRIFSGTLRTDDVVRVAGNRSLFTGEVDDHHRDHHEEERVGALHFPVGTELKTRRQAIAGDIVLVAKLSNAETSDTLSGTALPLLIEPWKMPTPQLPIAIRAKTRRDEDKMAGAMARLVVEDTTVHLDRDAETDQLVLWTVGQSHADLLLGRLGERYGVDFDVEPVRVAHRETLTEAVKTLGRHVKQSGGHGQFAVCEVTFEPLARGAGFEFVDKVVGGAVPRQFIASVEKGIVQQMAKGTRYGAPMVDLRATLTDGKAHSVDSSDMAFQSAGAAALREAAQRGSIALLEPLEEIQVVVPEDRVGTIITDLATRRGQVQGTDMDREGLIIVSALVPASELNTYTNELRSMAQGTAQFTRRFHSYELAPQEVIDQYPL